MADGKTKRHLPALIHASIYALPFFMIGSWEAVTMIWATHFLIDRYSLAKYLVWVKNRYLCPYAFMSDEIGFMKAKEQNAEEGWMEVRKLQWINCKATGYPQSMPAWLTVWLLIIADNTLHLTINYLALAYL